MLPTPICTLKAGTYVEDGPEFLRDWLFTWTPRDNCRLLECLSGGGPFSLHSADGAPLLGHRRWHGLLKRLRGTSRMCSEILVQDQ